MIQADPLGHRMHQPFGNQSVMDHIGDRHLADALFRGDLPLRDAALLQKKLDLGGGIDVVALGHGLDSF